MKKKLAWIDTETGGLDSDRYALLQVAIMIEIDNEIKSSSIHYMRPFKGDFVNSDALAVNGFTVKEISLWPNPQKVFTEITEILDSYVDRYDINDKFIFAGYNAKFDVDFLRAFWSKCDDKYFGSYFFTANLDVISTVAEAILNGIIQPMRHFRLVDVCEQLGIEFDGKAHDALADIKATRETYYKIQEKRKEQYHVAKYCRDLDGKGWSG